MADSPFESCDIGSSQTLFSGPFYHEKPVREFFLKIFHDLPCSVRRVVFYYYNMVLSFESKNSPDDFLDILLFVVSRNDYYLFVHN